MKKIITLLLLALCITNAFAQSSCGTAIAIPTDSTCIVYSFTANQMQTGSCVFGTGNSLFLKVTSDANATCILMDIETVDSTGLYSPDSVEIYVYSGQQCNNNQLITQYSICLPAGKGLWSPSSYVTFLSNHTYYFRIISQASKIKICARPYSPLNNYCIGATPIDATMAYDQNACHKGSYEVYPDQLCAFTLENTALYSFIVLQNGYSILNIQNIYCSNYSTAGTSAAGFQIGFFTGNCSSLQWLYCTTGSTSNQNGFAQFTSPLLQAGDTIFVAIDGTSGSRCSYGVSISNSVPLSLYSSHYVYKREWKLVNDGGGFSLINTRNIKTSIIVFDTLGRKLYQTTTNGSLKFGGSWPSGYYLVLVNGYGKLMYK